MTHNPENLEAMANIGLILNQHRVNISSITSHYSN